MATTEAQPRFGQSVKGLLSDKVGSCSVDVIALTRQVLKVSRSQELLGQAARNMVIQEDAILHSEDISMAGDQFRVDPASRPESDGIGFSTPATRVWISDWLPPCRRHTCDSTCLLCGQHWLGSGELGRDLH
ncbi:BLOC-1-related complex subunit 7 isoform X1 [Phycodurus eques]|uniref:BLOC-1-related complex subunit 7 isoform X1 n=1 Tax=Phycodurus eques TaxID=693459 RepID=UPI002ACF05A2|nr:BLOC-1-related complex subunit 7 isoform X1 [Phycodurus eques]